MKIKFKKPDPRAGTVAQMDSSRGQHFIDIGCAVLVKENEGSDSGASNEDGKAEAPKTRAELDRALDSLPGENNDPEYVVGALRSYFGDLVTDEDEKRARAAFSDQKADKPTVADANLTSDEPTAQPQPPEQPAKGGKKGKGA